MKKSEKEEFYNKYVKDHRTEDEKMLDAIHENAQRSLSNIKYKEKSKGQSKSHKWLSIAVMLTDLIIIALLIVLVIKIWV